MVGRTPPSAVGVKLRARGSIPGGFVAAIGLSKPCGVNGWGPPSFPDEDIWTMPTKLERRSGPGVGAPVRHHGASAANAAGRRVSGRLDIEYHAEIVVRIEIGLILALAYPGAKE